MWSVSHGSSGRRNRNCMWPVVKQRVTSLYQTSRTFVKIKQITEIYLVTCLTLAPIWLPHWPAWMCTISRILAAVSVNERYKFQTHKPHIVTGESVSDHRARGRFMQTRRNTVGGRTCWAAVQFPSAGAGCIDARHQIGLWLPINNVLWFAYRWRK